MNVVLRIVLLGIAISTNACGNDVPPNANAAQIEVALSECSVLTKNFVSDPALGGRYLITYHPDEPDYAEKMVCVSSHLSAHGVEATSFYSPHKNQ